MRKQIFFITISLLILGCANRELRGEIISSPDNQTYLVIEDDNGGGCGKIFVDGKEWVYKIGEKGEIEPGEHTIECGGEIGFIIQKGTTFYFDYWGP